MRSRMRDIMMAPEDIRHGRVEGGKKKKREGHSFKLPPPGSNQDDATALFNPDGQRRTNTLTEQTLLRTRALPRHLGRERRTNALAGQTIYLFAAITSLPCLLFLGYHRPGEERLLVTCIPPPGTSINQEEVGVGPATYSKGGLTCRHSSLLPPCEPVTVT